MREVQGAEALGAQSVSDGTGGLLGSVLHDPALAQAGCGVAG